jgi:hypothetical protein
MLGLTLVWGFLLVAVVQNVVLAASPEQQIADLPPLPEIDPSLSFLGLAAQSNVASLPAPADPITLPDPSWRIGVVTDGIYALDYVSLGAAGVPVATADPDAYRLFWRGEEVALDDSDVGSAFEAGEAFYFYGKKFHGSTQEEKYTDENVYWLTVDESTSGLRMSTRDVTPEETVNTLPWYTETLHMEENLLWWSRWSTAPGTDATWFWNDVITDAVVTSSYSFALSNPVIVGDDAVLAVELAGRTTNVHHVRFALNETVVGEALWSGDVGHVATLTFPASILVEGQNTLNMTILDDYGTQWIYLNWFEIRYPREIVMQDAALTWEFADPSALSRYRVYLPLVIRAGDRLFSAERPIARGSNGVNLGASETYTYAAKAYGFDVNAPLFYDVTDPLRAVKLTGGVVSSDTSGYTAQFVDAAPLGTTYHAVDAVSMLTPTSVASYTLAGPWLSPESGADLIVIAPRDFFSAIQPLVERRRSQGLRVQLVDVEDAYALFNGGVVHPEAIRAFVAYAHAHWPGLPPQYLLLVGDASFNLKGFNEADYGAWTPPVIPPYLDFIDPDQGEVPVDAYFGDVTGDGLPELSVGRIPAYTSAAVAGVVDKILTYESRPSAAWMDRTLFVADDGHSYIEGFSAVLDGLLTDYVPLTVVTDTVYIQEYCGLSGGCPAATQALTESWGQGAALLTYAGHGSIHRWAHEPLLLNEQLTTLPPMEGMPFIISLDCWDGYWIFPPRYPNLKGRDVRSLGEWATTVLTDRGAIGLFGPAGLGYLSIEEPMAQAMYDGMFNQGIFRIGDLTQLARQAVPWSYLARSYTLLGDPTLTLPWWQSLTVEPVAITVTSGSTVSLPSTVVVSGTTRFGAVYGVTPTWTAAVGEVDSMGLYTAPTIEQQTTITAHRGQVSTTLTVDVVSAP